MLDDLFDTEEQLLSGVKEGQVQSSWDRLPRNCADELPLPQLPRKKGYPIGLKNQGATCYLNSLLQILYHTPELRKVILDLPLCVDNIEQKSQFLNHPQKHKFMLGFQRLFSQMALCDKNSLTTEYLKDAFGWEGAEHVQQHDIEQAMKIIFDTFERALAGTIYEKNIRQLFKGISSQYKSCRNCTVTSERLQDFYGLTVQVKGIQSLQQSLMSFLTAESMEGDNKIFCQTCDSKQDMWLGTRLKTLPSILFFTFRRFEFDFQKMDRVKLNDFFSFDMEYNFAHLLQESKGEEEYELYGVLIHGGSAHGGHYIAFSRDVMQESDWKKSLEEAQQFAKKLEEERKNEGEVTDQQKKNREALEKENQVHQMKQPSNKQLLENWFDLNDSICTGIDAKKISSKYEGSQSAYIVFYRRKNIELPSKIEVPSYFVDQIKKQNQELQKQRGQYETKKNQIIMRINGNEQTLSIRMRVSDFLERFCPAGFALVNEAKHNDLPYYPMQITSEKQYGQDTLQKLDVIHQSTWITYLIESPEYQEIKDFIHIEKRPFELNVLVNEQNHKMVFYQDQTLSALRVKIEYKLEVPYEKQIIKVVTPYKQLFVTDDLSNDDVLLTKLSFVHESQAIVKELKTKEEDEKTSTKKQQTNEQLYCFIVERDDVIGIKRMYFDKRRKLQQLFNYIINAQTLPKTQKRRLRNMNGDRLFYESHYETALEDLNFDEQMIKLRIERGEIPVKGDICLKAKMQSQYQSQTVPQMIQHIFDPNTGITEIKKFFCEIANLNHDDHRVYMTDWMGEPVRSITKEKQSIFDAGFSAEEIICIRDLNSPIGSELLHFEVFETKSGSPEDTGTSFRFKIQQTKTLLEMKNELLQTQNWKERNLKPKQLRLRQLKRDYMFGTIFREHNKILKNMTFNTNKLVIQELKEEEELTDDEIVLILKKRNTEKRLYDGIHEFIFNAGKNPTIQTLKERVLKQIENKPEDNLILMKYFNYNFQWSEISEKTIDKFLKGKSPNEKKNKKKNKKEEEKEDQPKTQENKEKVEEQKKQKPSEEIKEQKKQKPSEEVKEQKEDKQKPAQLPAKEGKKKKGKQKNEGKTKQDKRKQQCLNLRRAPILLKDGDWVGYGFYTQLKGDDYQTDEDLTLRALKKDSKNIPTAYRKENDKGFKLGVDF